MTASERLREAALRYAGMDAFDDYAFKLAWNQLARSALAYARANRKAEKYTRRRLNSGGTARHTMSR